MLNKLQVQKALLSVALVALGLPGASLYAEDAAQVGVVSHVKVLSDKVEDVSSPEAWRRAYITAGMSDQEKVLAIWRTVVKYRHQIDPPDEYLQDHVHDIFKTIHVYGYGQCCCASSHVETLARYLGLEARGWAINVHSVPEVQYDNSWHTVDGSLMNYFLNPDGKIASVADIKKAVLDWHAEHPGYRGNDGKLRQFAAAGGWKKGPALLASSGERFWDANGINRAGWHGWPSTMQEYDCKEFPFDYGGSMGYELNVQLREGERLTRNWFNHGLHVNQLEGAGDHPLAKDVAPLGMCRKLGDVAPGRIGNGRLEYDVPLASGAFRRGALAAENLATRGEDPSAPAAVHVKDPAQPGLLIIGMPSSYVYLSGKVKLQPVVGPGGSIAVAFSDNHGLDWTEIARIDAAGPQTLDLKKQCYRRYDYRLKFQLLGKGTGLDALAISHDIQHSQAPLPALLPGENKISFSAGPYEGTVTLEGGTSVHLRDKERNLFYKAFHPVLTGGMRTDGLRPGANGTVTFPIATPGEMTRLRMNAFWRARDKRDGYEVALSLDGGKHFRPVAKLGGPTAGTSRYFTFADIAPGNKEAQLRLSGHEVNTAMLFGLRIDADYKQPCGGFRPVKITYAWEEDGKPQTSEHVATRPEETYSIHLGPKAVVKSYTVELAR
ncbi:MAG: hypothetical protein ABSF26_08255 [Thermoguttaceae bacterium]